MSDVIDHRLVRLKDHPWLNDLRRPGWMWEGAAEDQEVLIVATSSGKEWAAYCQMPYPDGLVGPGLIEHVADHGDKLPEKVALDLVPPYLVRGKRYRP